jgi:membrane fusion protein (multidrug efflux system)
MRFKRVRWWVGALGLLVLLLALGGVKAAQFTAMAKQGKAFKPPPESVTSATVVAQDWPAERSTVGTLVAVRGVTLSPELVGTVRDIRFENGSFVQQGDVLVHLDTTTEEAQLQGALADAKLSRQNLEREHVMKQGRAVPQAEVDAAEAKLVQADAAVANLRALIAKKTLRAPFSGRVAIRQVELGQLVQAGSPVVSLQTIDPIYVELSLPQQALEDVAVRQKAQVTFDVFPGQSWEGTVTTVNPEVDVASRSVRIRATIPNPDGRLEPGMFANVAIYSGVEHRVLAIPATAVLYAPYGDSVFVLEKKDNGTTVATQRFVRVGDRRGDFIAAISGLKEGDVIVSSGAFKLRTGMEVTLNEALAPPAELEPRPVDR